MHDRQNHPDDVQNICNDRQQNEGGIYIQLPETAVKFFRVLFFYNSALSTFSFWDG